MRRRTYKRGPSLEYEKKRKERLAAAEAAKVPQEIPLFRGFLPADGFVTSLGARGMKLDSMWSKYLVDSFTQDDRELAEIAMESCLCDVSATVEGGQYGCPMSIGGYGFYTTEQFDNQAEILYKTERRYCTGMFLSVDEWKGIDEKLRKIAEYGISKLPFAVVGDTWTNMAVRDNAYKVAKLFLENNVDPLLQNQNGDDLVAVVKRQYSAMAIRLSDLQLEKETSSNRVLLPTEEKDLEDRERITREAIENMSVFIGHVRENLIVRRKQIEEDKWTLKTATLRRQEVPLELRWNCEQEEKVDGYIKEMGEMRQYIADRLARFAKVSASYVPLSAVMSIHQKVLKGRKKKAAAAAAEAAAAAAAELERRKNAHHSDDEDDHIEGGSPFSFSSGFNVLKQIEKPEDDEFKLTPEEQALYSQNKHKLANMHRSKDALSKNELASRTGIDIGDDEDDYTYQQMGEGENATFHRMRVPRRGRKKSESAPTLGVLSQNELEVVHYR